MFIHLIFKLTASKKLFTRVLFPLFSILFCLDAFPYTVNGQIWRDSVTGIDFQLIDRNSGTSYTEASIFRQGALDCGTPKNCVIPATVTYNGNVYPVTDILSASFQYKTIESVTLPDSLISIGNFAFRGNNLTSVTIPDSVTTIGNNAFDANSNLTSLILGSSVQVIPQEAFKGASLTSVTIPNNVTSIETGAFRDNNQLTSLTIGNSVTSIGQLAFYQNDLRSVTIPDSVTTIDVNAFNGNPNLTNLILGSSVQTIGQNAFIGGSLTSVIIPSSVTTIGTAAFQGNGLLSVIFEGNYSSNFHQQAFFTGNATLANIYAYNGTTGWSGKTFFYDGSPQKSRAVTLVAPPPGAPTGLSAVAGDGNAVISFTAGSANGGTISNYQYSIDAGSTYTALSPTVAVSPITIAPLTNGVTYSILLKAVNSGGLASTASAAVSVTPGAPAISGVQGSVQQPPPDPSIAAAVVEEQRIEQESKANNDIAKNTIIDEVSKINLRSLKEDPESQDLVDDIAAKTANLLEGISSSDNKSLYSTEEKKEALDVALDVLKFKAVSIPPAIGFIDLSSNITISPQTNLQLKKIDSNIEFVNDIAKVLIELPGDDSSVKEIGENLISNVIDIISPLVITAVNLDDETAGKNADAAVDKFLDIQETITTNVSFNSGQLYIPSSFKNPNSVLNLVTKKKNLNIVNMKQRRKRANYLDVVNLLLAEPASDANANSLRTVSALEDGSTPTVGLSTANRFNGVAGFSGVDHNEVHSDFYFGNKVIPANIVSVSYSETTVDRPFVFNEDGSLKYKMDANITATLYPAFYDVFELLQAIRSDFSSNVSVSENNVIKIRKDGASYYAKATFSPFELSESALANADAQFFIIDEVYTVIYGDGTEESLVPHFDPKLFDYLAAQDHSYQYKKKTGALVIDGRSYMPDYLVEPLESFQDQLYLGINGDGRFDMALEQTYVNQDNILDLVVYTKAGKQAFIAQ